MRKHIVFTAAITILLINNLFAQSIGEISVKKWPDDKKSAFSFTFDDGYLTDYEYVRPVMNQFGFKATFYVIADFLTDNPPGNWRYGTWWHFKQLAQDGHEIGSHMMTHSDLTKMSIGNINTPGTVQYEMYQSKRRIEEKIPGHLCITCAYPYTNHNSSVDNIAKMYYQAGRAVGNSPNNSSMSENELFGVKCQWPAFNLPRNSLSDDLDELESFKNYIQNSINSGGWAMLMGHEVYPFSMLKEMLNKGAYYPITTEWLTDLSTWIKTKSNANDIWVGTVANVVRYMKQRDNFYYQVLSSTNSEIQISVSDNLDNTIYNYPLTVDITVPFSWDAVSVTQGSNSQVVYAYTSGNKKVIRTTVIPDNGIVKLFNNAAPPSQYSISGKIVYHNSNQTPIQNAEVKLQKSGETIATLYTDEQGNFYFPDLSTGTYSLTFKKTGNWGGVNSSDALMTVRYFASLESLDDIQKMAADVNDDGKINSTDALLILRRFTMVIDSFTKPNWLFSPNPITINLSDSNYYQVIKAIAAGDVNRSYVP